MEENAGARVLDSDGRSFKKPANTPVPLTPSTPLSPRAVLAVLSVVTLALSSCSPARHVDVLARIKATGKLVYGSDKEGGGPYIYPNPEAPRDVVGFEVEIVRALANDIGAEPVFSQ